jgi:hypothetical protein
LVAQQPDQAPDDSWWIVLFMAREVASRSAITFKVFLQGKTLLLQQQREALMNFINEVCVHFGIEALEEEPAPLPAGSNIIRSVNANFEVNSAAIRNTWMDMG